MKRPPKKQLKPRHGTRVSDQGSAPSFNEQSTQRSTFSKKT
jgi:hypothetical protein